MSDRPVPRPPVKKPVPATTQSRIDDLNRAVEQNIRHLNKPPTPQSPYSDESLFKKLREQAAQVEKNPFELSDKEIDDILFGLEDQIFAEKRSPQLAQFSEKAEPSRPKKEGADKPTPQRAEHLMQYPLKNHNGLQALLNSMQEEK